MDTNETAQSFNSETQSNLFVLKTTTSRTRPDRESNIIIYNQIKAAQSRE